MQVVFDLSDIVLRPNKNICVSGNGSENFREGRHTRFLFNFFPKTNNNSFMHFEIYLFIIIPDEANILTSAVL